MTDLRATLPRLYYENNGSSVKTPHVVSYNAPDGAQDMNVHETLSLIHI